MIAPAITRRLKLDPEIRTTAGVGVGVSVTDTMSSVPNTVAHKSTRPAKRRTVGFVRCKAANRNDLQDAIAFIFRGAMRRKTVTDVSRRARFIEEPRAAPKRTWELKDAKLGPEPIRSPKHGERTFRYGRNPGR